MLEFIFRLLDRLKLKLAEHPALEPDWVLVVLPRKTPLQKKQENVEQGFEVVAAVAALAPVRVD